MDQISTYSHFIYILIILNWRIQQWCRFNDRTGRHIDIVYNWSRRFFPVPIGTQTWQRGTSRTCGLRQRTWAILVNFRFFWILFSKTWFKKACPFSNRWWFFRQGWCGPPAANSGWRCSCIRVCGSRHLLKAEHTGLIHSSHSFQITHLTC